MRIDRKLILSIAAIVLLPGIVLSEAGTMSLANMVKYSDFIAVGKVVNTRVHGKRVAELQVIQVLKGDQSWKRVRFHAAPIWACDTSRAEENEIGLFFLTNNMFGTEGRTSPYIDSEGVPTFFITHSGRGRMIFQHIDGEDYLYAHKKGEVRFPGSLRYARHPNAKDRDLGLIKLGDVISYVKSKL